MNRLSRRSESDRHRRAARLRPVTIRLAAGDDAPAMDRVAARDSRPLPPAPQLIAERDGSIEAVLSLANGALVADPFRRTAELVELLRSHGSRA